MKKYFILCGCIAIIVVLVVIGFNISKNKKIEQKLNDAKELYLVYLNGPGFLGNKNKFQIYNENGELIKEDKAGGDGVSATYIDDNIIYFGGQGGLYKFDSSSLNLEKIANENINIIKFYDDVTYYYISGENKICHDDSCLDVEMLVGDFVLKDEYLYVLGNKLKIYKDEELVEEYDYSNQKIITKLYDLNDKMFIVNEYKILEVDGTEIKELKSIKKDEILLYYEDEEKNNYIFDIDDQILMYVELNEDYSYNVLDEINITKLFQSSYDFSSNTEIEYGIDTYNNLILFDEDGNEIKEFILDMNVHDLIYGAYRLK